MYKYLNIFYNYKIIVEIFLSIHSNPISLCYQTKAIKIAHTVG